MKTFLEAFDELSDIESLKDALAKNKGFYELSGCLDIGKSHLIYGLGEGFSHRLIVAENEEKARGLYEELRFFMPEACYFPPKDMLFYQSDIHGTALNRERIRAIRLICEGEKVAVVTTIDALLNRVPSRSYIEESAITVRVGEELDLDEMAAALVSLGYESVSKVEAAGEFAVRGGILDVWSLTDDHPVRIELWDEDVDSIRVFDPASQRSVEDIKKTVIFPAMELVLTDDDMYGGLKVMRADMEKSYDAMREKGNTEEAYRLKSSYEEFAERLENGLGRSEAENHLLYFCDDTVSLIDYLPGDTAVFLDEPSHLKDAAALTAAEFKESMTHRLRAGDILPRDAGMMLEPEGIFLRLISYPSVAMSVLDPRRGLLGKSDGTYHVRMSSVVSCNNHFDQLVKELSSYKKRGYRIVVLSPSRTRSARLADDLNSEGIEAYYSEDRNESVYAGKVLVTTGGISRGFEYPDSRFVFICESDIFGSRAAKCKKRRKAADHIESLSDLAVGDYVVHENYGLGIFKGMEKIEVEHVMKDYIKIAYAGGSNLYVLATQMDMISKYGNAGDKKPKLSSLGNLEWKKTKARVRSSVGEVAHELVELYAKRSEKSGYVYGEDTVWQKEFEETFPYEETDGQLAAIEDVKHDMMSSKIMDRLICGDVGFGKTEIAIRAAFKAVQENKQVAYLVPTTILAQQHYNTFTQRMKDYPVRIELLSRFKTAAENKAVIEKLKNGGVDIVIGTHRLLSKDVSFKDLGLLIIDEEQRFGVAHKERIKQMRSTVDVMTLSATPIPRTLHMSLIGIRDMSLLDEAPQERVPIQTFVFERNDELIREAIRRELSREGQVYYVVNRVRDIADIAASLSELVPDARIAYAHGKMPEGELETIMTDFINREIDVLVATTIIEIGLDISNVNTIMIHDADRFGLSQLYQLRGRVGRSNRTAYAFLMYRRDKMLKEIAEKRLSAIREFTELGSGYKIAMRDLEIRGAGNLLGEEQHGHMEAVGYDLYCKLLNDAVRREKGGGTSEELDFDTSVDIAIDAYIPDTYIRDELQKLDIYKRIASVTGEEEKTEIVDELIDRFGEPPVQVTNLLYIAILRAHAHKVFIREFKQDADRVKILLDPAAGINPLGIPALVSEYAPYLEFYADSKKPHFIFYYKRNSRIDQKALPDLWMKLILDMEEKLLEAKTA